MSRTKVRFIDGGGKSLVVCEIEASPQHALSQDLHVHLEALELVVVHRETRQSSERLLQRVHIAGSAGCPISDAHRLQLQSLLLSLAATGTSEFPTGPPPRGNPGELP